jgi:hypothetical protein
LQAIELFGGLAHGLPTKPVVKVPARIAAWLHRSNSFASFRLDLQNRVP